MEMIEPLRVGVEINRKKDESWASLVIRYARHRDLEHSALKSYSEYVSEGFEEPYAALRALAEHACTDVIIDSQHHIHEETTIN